MSAPDHSPGAPGVNRMAQPEAAPEAATGAEAVAVARGRGQRLAPARSALGVWWRGLAARERRALALALALLVLAALWWLALGPALRVLREAPTEHDRLERQWQQMQALATEAKALRAVAPVAPEQSRAALQAAVGRLNERAQLSLQGPRAVLTLKGVGSAELAGLLAELRAGARANVVEASLAPSSPGVYSGSLTLTLGAAAR